MDPCNAHMRTSDGCTQNKFLDLIVFVTDSKISFDVFNCNQDFCVSGLASQHVKHRFRPALGSSNIMIDRLTANILTKRARWQQIHLESSDVVKHTVLDCSELLLLGYKPQHIQKAFYAAVAHDKYYAICLHIVRTLMKNAIYFDLQWRMSRKIMDVMQSLYDIDPNFFTFDTYDL